MTSRAGETLLWFLIGVYLGLVVMRWHDVMYFL